MFKPLALAVALAAVSLPVLAQTTSPTDMLPMETLPHGRPPMMRDTMRQERLEHLTPAQREDMKKRMEARKAKWDAMTDEQRTQVKARMEERRKQWEAMTPEQRKALREKMEEHREALSKMSPEERAQMMQQQRAQFPVSGSAPRP